MRQIFLIQMKHCLQRMCNHMVGRTASVSPFYSLLPGLFPTDLNRIQSANTLRARIYNSGSKSQQI